MMRASLAVTILLSVFSGSPAIAQEQEASDSNQAMKEMILACTYGVLAGTLVGAASLAFTDQPGENLQRVARGASIGLYLGIGLGLYVVYIVPGQIEKERNKQLEGEDSGLPPEGFFQKHSIFPLISDTGKIEGVQSQFTLLQF